MQDFSRATKTFLYTCYAAGILLTVFNLAALSFENPLMLIALCILASLTSLYFVIGPTDRSHYAINFVVFGFTFTHMGLPAAILIIVISGLVLWVIKKKPVWFIQLFNVCSFIIVMQAASLMYDWINPNGLLTSWQGVIGIIGSMIVFTLLNHLITGMIIWLARAENFAQSGVFGILSLMMDLTLLVLGASLSIVWNYNPYAVGLFLVPLYLLYSTLRVPALERQTEIDEKTGLFNHRYFSREMQSELNRANRFDRPMAVIMADLDLLRNINNTYGHLAGDEVLLSVAKILKRSVREYDVVARFGGEEFSILLPETTIETAFARAERLRKEIEAAEIAVPTSILPIKATMSFGVACREGFDQPMDEIVHNADLALYKAKYCGRNRTYACFDQKYFSFTQDGAPVAVVNEEKAVDTLVETDVTVAAPASTEMPGAGDVKPFETAPLPNATQPPPTPAKETLAPAANRARATNLYIFATVLVAALLYYLISSLPLYPFNLTTTRDAIGLAMFALFVALTEWFSIDIYIRNTAVSTSAAPMLAGALLFGPFGALVLGLVFAFTAWIKNHSPFSRFLFNAGNQIIASMAYLGIISLTGRAFSNWGPITQMVLVIIAAMIVYLITTTLVAAGMSISLQQKFAQVWRDQFAWLAPFYIGIGFMTYALVFGYHFAYVLGMLVMIVPLVLLRFSQKQAIDRTRAMVAELREMNANLVKSANEISALNLGLLETLAESIDMHDPYVMGHSRQVTLFAVQIAQRMGLNDAQIELIRKGSLLHDVGKLRIPDTILSKPARLTNHEYEIIKKHPEAGASLLSRSPSLTNLIPIVKHHHEFYDGRGYPGGLKGNEIPIEARIVSVADAIEAMGADRPYRKALDVTAIIAELQHCSGTQFDPRIIQVAVKLLEGEGEKLLVRSRQKAETVPTL